MSMRSKSSPTVRLPGESWEDGSADEEDLDQIAEIIMVRVACCLLCICMPAIDRPLSDCRYRRCQRSL